MPEKLPDRVRALALLMVPVPLSVPPLVRVTPLPVTARVPLFRFRLPLARLLAAPIDSVPPLATCIVAVLALLSPDRLSVPLPTLLKLPLPLNWPE